MCPLFFYIHSVSRDKKKRAHSDETDRRTHARAHTYAHAHATNEKKNKNDGKARGGRQGSRSRTAVDESTSEKADRARQGTSSTNARKPVLLLPPPPSFYWRVKI